MQVVADLHLHSKYSRAVSQNMILPTMSQFAAEKGLDLLTASDWTHPLWMKEIQALLEEKADGVYHLKNGTDQMKDISFVLSTEISSIYKQGDKLRRIHNLMFAPSFEVAEKIAKELLKRGANLSTDGRPIVGLSSRDVLELILSVDGRSLLIPCHVWTPHFGLFGAASGFDSIEEAFGDLTKHIYAIETGLSSDPEMNWNIPELGKRSILSFSDAHSPAKMGREATVFELEEVTYENLRKAIMAPSLKIDGRKSKVGVGDRGLKVEEGNIHLPSSTLKKPSIINHPSSNRIIYTLEFYPEEGKYHYSGHRNCKVSFGPDEIREKGDTCPICHRRLTEGVFLRLQHLAGTSEIQTAATKTNDYGLKWHTDRSRQHPPYVKLVPLLEIVAESLDSTVASQKTRLLYNKLTNALGSELQILLKASLVEIKNTGGERVAQAIAKVRSGDIYINPGFDGEYGVVKIWEDHDVAKDTDEESTFQMTLDL